MNNNENENGQQLLTLEQIEALEEYRIDIEMADHLQAQVRLQALKINRMMKLPETEAMKLLSNQIEMQISHLEDLCQTIGKKYPRTYRIVKKQNEN